jgi:hypothetical protein
MTTPLSCFSSSFRFSSAKVGIHFSSVKKKGRFFWSCQEDPVFGQ